NAGFLKRNSEMNSSAWTNMIGIMSLLQVALWGMTTALSNGVEEFNFGTSREFAYFCFWTASLGIISSWLGTMTWNIGAKKLPVTLAGQFIVMEPLFGLVYVFIHKGQLPTLLEFAGFSLCMIGILLTLRKIQALRLRLT